MKKLTAKQYAEALLLAAEQASTKERPVVVKNFLAALRRHRALRLLPRIVTHVQLLEDKRSGITRIMLTVADAAVAPKLTAKLKRTVKHAAVDVIEDPALKAGVRLRLGDTLIDASLRTQLQHLHHHLAN